MPIDIAVVPVAGHGTRLLPATKSQPKEMLSIGRKPVVQYVIEELMLNGIQRTLFITSRGKYAIEQHFDVDDTLTGFGCVGVNGRVTKLCHARDIEIAAARSEPRNVA